MSHDNSTEIDPYYIFEPQLLSWKGGLVQAALTTETHWSEFHEWSCSAEDEIPPWKKPVPHFVFEVKSKAPHPDNYWTGTEFLLFSKRMVKIFQDTDVRFEKFDAVVIDRKNKERLPLEYSVFRILEMIPALEIDVKSQFYGKRLVVRSELKHLRKLFFRDTTRQNLIIIHENLKEKLDSEGITGCKYIPLSEYKGVGFPGQEVL